MLKREQDVKDLLIETGKTANSCRPPATPFKTRHHKPQVSIWFCVKHFDGIFRSATFRRTVHATYKNFVTPGIRGSGGSLPHGLLKLAG